MNSKLRSQFYFNVSAYDLLFCMLFLQPDDGLLSLKLKPLALILATSKLYVQ